jgi:tetratricopeptide (TPR) repeat protein
MRGIVVRDRKDEKAFYEGSVDFNAGEGYRKKGIDNYNEKIYLAAVKDCNKALSIYKSFCTGYERDIGSIKTYNLLGHCAHKLGKNDEAKKHYEYVISKNSEDFGLKSEAALAHVALANICYSEKNLDEAFKNYSAGIELFKKLYAVDRERHSSGHEHDYDNFNVAYNNRAQVYFEQGQFAKARADLERSNKINPELANEELAEKAWAKLQEAIEKRDAIADLQERQRVESAKFGSRVNVGGGQKFMGGGSIAKKEEPGFWERLFSSDHDELAKEWNEKVAEKKGNERQ